MRFSIVPLILGPLALALAGCTSPLTRSAITSNLVQEEAHNAYLLLNIARAQERMPMHFTQLDVVRAGPGGIPFAGSTLGFEWLQGSLNEAFKPSISLNAGADTVSLVSQNFTRGITTPVDPKLLAYFANQGWPQAMLLHLLVSSIQVLDDKGDVVKSYDNSPVSPSFKDFQDVVTSLQQCRLSLSEHKKPTFYSAAIPVSAMTDIEQLSAAKAAGLVPIPTNKDGTTENVSDPPAFVRLGMLTSESRLRFTQAETPSGKDTSAVCEIAYPKQAAVISGERTNPRTLSAEFKTMSQREPPAQASGGKKQASSFNLVLRSTQSMLYYLGELSRCQNPDTGGKLDTRCQAQSLPVKIPLADKSAKLFDMVLGPKQPDAAISVPYKGQYLTVLGYRPGEREDRSVQTLSLLSLVFSLQNHSGDAPSIRNVRVIP